MTSTVTMGLIGAGFAADLAARSLQGVYGTDVNVSAVCSRNRARANEFARTWHIPSVYTDPGQLMSDPLLDAVCICVPNWAHASLTIAALDAGKHVICEKPLTGAFGVPGVAGPERAAAERDRARASVDAIDDAVQRSGRLLITFSDGTRATIAASFATVGGVRNVLEAYTTTAAYRANLTPNDQLLAYTPDPEAFAGEYLHEKIETRTGWMSTSPDEDWTRGYPQEMQDFITCIATGREPVSDLTLAAQVVDVIYAAYLSAEQGARVALSPTPQGQQKGIST